jgi:hypothetical protein
MDGSIIVTEPPVSTAEIAKRMDQRTSGPGQPADGDRPTPLLTPEMTDRMRESWTNIQAAFVDEPRRSVQQADELVGAAIKQIAETFAGERQNLESQWDRAGDVSTEDLRVALTRYRSFFQRLLSV